MEAQAKQPSESGTQAFEALDDDFLAEEVQMLREVLSHHENGGGHEKTPIVQAVTMLIEEREAEQKRRIGSVL